MFEILKQKLRKIASSISEKFEEKEIEEPTKKGFGEIFKRAVRKVTEKKLSEKDLEFLNEFEKDLLGADVAYEVAKKIKEDLKKNLIGRKIKRGEEKKVVFDSLKEILLEILTVPKIDLEEIIRKAKNEKRPAVLLFFGVNGSGKSLNLSKVAFWLKNKGYKPILAAGDTYRAAGSVQLEKYGEAIGVRVISSKIGSDSCAVIFDARKAAEAKGYDIVLADTSGRMHTKKNLLEELAKIVRVNKPDLKILVLDSLCGSDVVLQCEFFDKAVGIDAVLFSKVDINEKGGNIFSICYLFKKPILFLGIGQKPEHLIPYDPNVFVSRLLSQEIY